MANSNDDFDGIDISGPWGGVRIGPGGGRRSWEDMDSDGDAEYRRIRRSVRNKLDFYRHAAMYGLVVGFLLIIDWLFGNSWWVQWVAGIWGIFVVLQFFTTFISPNVWGKDVEERMVRNELSKRRGRAIIVDDPDAEEPPPPSV